MTTTPTRPVHLRTFAVVNYFLDLDQERRRKPSPTPPDDDFLDVEDLHKLIYLAHGFELAWADQPLIHEPVHAARGGPRIPSLDREFADFQAAEPVTRYALTFWYPDGPEEGQYRLGSLPIVARLLPSADNRPLLGPGDRVEQMLDAVWTFYHTVRAAVTERLLTGKDSPCQWLSDTYNGRLPADAVIPNAKIKAQFDFAICLANLLPHITFPALG